jgi:hypothetical protein
VTARGLVSLLPVFVACASSQAMSPSTFVRSLSTPSDKAVAVVEDHRFSEHEAQPVDAAFVRRTLLASGLFNDEDANVLADPIAQELAAMGPRELVRITTWADDGLRRFFLFIHGARLRIHYFREATELEHFDAPLPAQMIAQGSTAAAGPSAATPEPAPAQASSPEPAPSAPPSAPAPSEPARPVPTPAQPASSQPAATPTPAPSSPSPVPARAPVTRRRVAQRTPAPPPLSEDEARQKLRDLDRMKDQGLIDGAEFKRKRKEILERL